MRRRRLGPCVVDRDTRIIGCKYASVIMHCSVGKDVKRVNETRNPGPCVFRGTTNSRTAGWNVIPPRRFTALPYNIYNRASPVSALLAVNKPTIQADITQANHNPLSQPPILAKRWDQHPSLRARFKLPSKGTSTWLSSGGSVSAIRQNANTANG